MVICSLTKGGGLKSLLMKVKDESKNTGLKFNIQKTKIMASGLITSWQNRWGKMETLLNFIFLGSKITADGGCSHKIKRYLFFGRITMTNLDSVLKTREISLPTKVHIVKAMVFLVVMHGCESWTTKKAEYQRTDAFKLWSWRRCLKSPLESKDIKPVNPKRNQLWIFIGRTDAEVEAPILGLPDAKSRLIGKNLDARKDWRAKDKRVIGDEIVR